MYSIHRPVRSLVVITSALVLCAALTLLSAGPVRAEVTFTNLYFFGADPTAGGQPTGNLIRGTDGNFYGTTNSAIFRATPAGNVTFLYRFPVDSFLDLAYLHSPLVQTDDGSLYGTTIGGGTSNAISTGNGTIFRLAPDGTLTTLHAFNGTDGLHPGVSLVLGADGNFYGSADGDGIHNSGTIFQLTPGGVFSVLHSFSASEGLFPNGSMVRTADGNLYGVTEAGGAAGEGTIFRLAADGTFTTVHAFAGPDGTGPASGLVMGSDGNLYGTTSAGGLSNDGTVFQFTPDGALTTLHDFNGADGNQPTALLAVSGGQFYGATAIGGPSLDNFGNNFGMIYKIGADGTFIPLHYFTGLDSNGPAGLVVDRDGTLYGTTTGEDSDGSPDIATGSIYKLAFDRAYVPPVLSVATTKYDLNGDLTSEVEILLTLSSTQDQPVKLRYTVAGSAVPGTDYEPLSGVVKFKKLQNTQLIHVQALFPARPVDTPPVVKIKFKPSSDYTVSGSRTLKIPLPSDD